jgi:hypothetical protein
MMRSSRTLTISIKRPAEVVYAFLSNPENLPKWAPGFCQSVRKAGEGWIAETAEGPLPFRFVARNPFGIVDHYVTTGPESEVFNPMRVLPKGPGSEVLFTLFRTEGMSEAKFREDQRLVEADLHRLQALLET